MKTITLNDALSDFDSLSIDEKEYALGVFKNKLAEERRAQLAHRVHTATKNYQTGRVKTGSVRDLLKDLQND
jgi:hypothetical protein